MNQWTYHWRAFHHDGTMVERWNPDGSENRPDPWRVAQFHLWSIQPGVAPVSLYVPKGARFAWERRHLPGQGMAYVAGWSWPDDPDHGCCVVCRPDGGFELRPRP